MPYQPLALKYRPQKLDDVVGQEVVTTTLRNALESRRIGHAYLFSGMRGVGKTSVARILAKCLNCRSFEEPTTEPCDSCESCTEIMAGRSIDVLEIDGASHTSVDDVRSLQENLIYAAARDRYKIYIVDEVHMLSKSAFNAFLKTLEEPPPHVVFIFATTEIHKIPPTVLSRCLLFDFNRVGSEAIAGRLKSICENEGIEIEDTAVDLLVFSSEGSIRDAVSALDQTVNYAGSKIAYDDALTALGLISRDLLLRFTGAVIEQNAEEAFAAVRKAADSGTDMRLFCRQLIRHVRDLLVTRSGGEGASLLPYSDKELALLREQSQRLSEEDLSRFFDILVKADTEMQLAATPQYHLEAAAVKMIHSTRLTPLTELIARVQSGGLSTPARAAASPIEQRLEFDSPPRKASRPYGGPKETPKSKLVAAARGSHIQHLVGMADDVRLDGNKLIAGFSSGVTAKTMENGANRDALREIAGRAFGAVDIEVVRIESGAAPREDTSPVPDEAPAMPEEKLSELPPEGDDQTGGAPVEVERKVKEDPLAGHLAQSLELTLERDLSGESTEEEER